MQLSNFECKVITNYIVEINSSYSSVKTLNSDNCKNKLCFVHFPLLIDERTNAYDVKVMATNQFTIDEYSSTIICKL